MGHVQPRPADPPCRVRHGHAGSLLERRLGFQIHKLQSGPLGGDQQIGSRIVSKEIDFLIFFWDPLEPQPHDPDVKALLRMAVVWNIPTACNRATVDFMISSPLTDGEYDRLVPDYDSYCSRRLASTGFGPTDDDELQPSGEPHEN